MKFKTYCILLSALIFAQCEKKKEQIDSKPEALYSFMVAGHAYGNPTNDPLGMYQPFVSEFPFIKNSLDISFSVLTGDVVYNSTNEEWDVVMSEMNQLELEYHIAAGNHDRSALFLELFEEYYYSFLVEDDLFIILSPTNWNIQGEQKDFLEETLEQFAPEANNIFVFCHELIWWSPDSIFQNVGINFLPHYPGSTNYWAEIDPIFRSFDKPIYLLAGDIGAGFSSSHYMYYNYDNVHLVASGMGKGGDDNYLIVKVFDGSVKIDLMAIEGDPYRLGDIELYELP